MRRKIVMQCIEKYADGNSPFLADFGRPGENC